MIERFSCAVFPMMRLVLLATCLSLAGSPLFGQAPTKPEEPAKGNPPKADGAPRNAAKPEQAPPAEPGKDAPKEPPKPEKEETFDDLPRKTDMAIPSVEECLTGPVRDWLMLIADRVLVIEPVNIRPGWLDDVNRQIKEALSRGPKETPEERARRMALNTPLVTLPDEPEQDYRIDVKYIKEIVYFEDLMLKRVDLLLDEKNVREAFQVLLALERRQRGWPGAVDRHKRVLFVEAAVRAEKGEREAALGLLEDLFTRDKAYPEATRRANDLVDPMIGEAIAAQDFRRARQYLRRLRALDAESPVARRRSDEMLAMSKAALDAARAAEQERKFDAAVTYVDQAAKYWPDTPELNQAHRRLTERYQRLRVGTWDLPRPGNEPVVTAADRRQRRLLDVPLFRPQRMGRSVVRFEAPLLQSWEPTDLGHSLRLQLKTHRESWESRPRISAGDLGLAIADRLDPRHPAYDERLATFIDSVTVPTPGELTIRFRAVPLRPEALFAFPIPVGRTVDTGETPPTEPMTSQTTQTAKGAAAASTGPTTWPFFEVERDDNHVVWRRSIPEPEVSGERLDRHLTEVVETRYATPEKALQGLLRGEVQFLPRVPAWTVRPLEQTNDYYLLRYDLPETHAIHFRPGTKAVSSRELRRALTYAINRPQILEEVFLKGAGPDFGRPASGLAASSGYASNPRVVQHKYDPVLALSLIPAVRKEFEGTLPRLKMACPADPFIQTAAKRMIDVWGRFGVDVELVPEDAPQWDMAYRVIQMAEPLVELWPVLTDPLGTDVTALRSLAPWFREQLLALDQASDFATAQTLLHRIHSQLWAEVFTIPLWELQPVMAIRKNVRGISNRPIVPYDGIERWRVESWYSRE